LRNDALRDVDIDHPRRVFSSSFSSLEEGRDEKKRENYVFFFFFFFFFFGKKRRWRLDRIEGFLVVIVVVATRTPFAARGFEPPNRRVVVREEAFWSSGCYQQQT